jgi:phospholipid/cholesterol/gamma-HCH transport system permease protein
MKVLGDVGRGTLGIFEYAGGAAALTAEAGGLVGRLKIRVAETFAQAYLLGVQSSAIVLLTSLFTGMVISLESANQAKSYGVSDLVGGAVAYVSSRELGPMLTAVVVAGRAGAAIAAEIGSMVVTEQIEALEALGLSPVQMLVVPRLIALVVMLPLLTIFADIVSIVGGMVLAKNAAGISYEEFIQSARVYSYFPDYVKGLFKAAVFAVLIVVIGCYQGFGVRGGAAGVGKATTGAVVTSIILIFVANFVLSLVFFGTTGTR